MIQRQKGKSFFLIIISIASYISSINPSYASCCSKYFSYCCDRVEDYRKAPEPYYNRPYYPSHQEMQKEVDVLEDSKGPFPKYEMPRSSSISLDDEDSNSKTVSCVDVTTQFTDEFKFDEEAGLPYVLVDKPQLQHDGEEIDSSEFQEYQGIFFRLNSDLNASHFNKGNSILYKSNQKIDDHKIIVRDQDLKNSKHYSVHGSLAILIDRGNNVKSEEEKGKCRLYKASAILIDDSHLLSTAHPLFIRDIEYNEDGTWKSLKGGTSNLIGVMFYPRLCGQLKEQGILATSVVIDLNFCTAGEYEVDLIKGSDLALIKLKESIKCIKYEFLNCYEAIAQELREKSLRLQLTAYPNIRPYDSKYMVSIEVNVQSISDGCINYQAMDSLNRGMSGGGIWVEGRELLEIFKNFSFSVSSDNQSPIDPDKIYLLAIHARGNGDTNNEGISLSENNIKKIIKWKTLIQNNDS